ncbi:MAG: fumarylacetoacetate hydrolase family protein [Solirubrobacterales bacterium]
MRYVTYRQDGPDRPGLEAAGSIVDGLRAWETAGLEGPPPARVRELLELPEDQRASLGEAAVRIVGEGDALDRDEAELRPPIPDPDKIIGLGLNYPTHAVEFGGDVPKAPQLFPKWSSSLVGPDADIVIPAAAPDEVDWEGEMTIVIGKSCKNVAAEEALDYVAGAMVLNDVTARDLQHATSQWTAGKAVDTFAPCGPALVTLDEVGDLDNLFVRTHVNGELMQDGNTSEMLFKVPETIAYISSFLTLLPGDIIATGTPTGVGFRRDPPIYLGAGDLVEIEVERVGKIANKVTIEGG